MRFVSFIVKVTIADENLCDRNVHRRGHVTKFYLRYVESRLPNSFLILTDVTSLTGNKMKHTVTLMKLRISLSLNIAGNIWDNVKTKLNKKYNKNIVVLRHSNVEM